MWPPWHIAEVFLGGRISHTLDVIFNPTEQKRGKTQSPESAEIYSGRFHTRVSYSAISMPCWVSLTWPALSPGMAITSNITSPPARPSKLHRNEFYRQYYNSWTVYPARALNHSDLMFSRLVLLLSSKLFEFIEWFILFNPFTIIRLVNQCKSWNFFFFFTQCSQ